MEITGRHTVKIISTLMVAMGDDVNHRSKIKLFESTTSAIDAAIADTDSISEIDRHVLVALRAHVVQCMTNPYRSYLSAEATVMSRLCAAVVGNSGPGGMAHILTAYCGLSEEETTRLIG